MIHIEHKILADKLNHRNYMLFPLMVLQEMSKIDIWEEFLQEHFSFNPLRGSYAIPDDLLRETTGQFQKAAITFLKKKARQ